MLEDENGRAAGTPAMVLPVDIGLSTGIAKVPGATRRATGGEDHSAPGVCRGLDHRGNFQFSGVVVMIRHIVVAIVAYDVIQFT